MTTRTKQLCTAVDVDNTSIFYIETDIFNTRTLVNYIITRHRHATTVELTEGLGSGKVQRGTSLMYYRMSSKFNGATTLQRQKLVYVRAEN